jgi:hypothetical protein
MQRNTTCSRLSTVPFANSPKISMGHLLGGEKLIFLIRRRGRPTVYDSRACGILSIHGPAVSLGSPRVGTIHAQPPTPHAPPLQAFLADFSQHGRFLSAAHGAKAALAKVLLSGLSESTRLLHRRRMRCRRLPTTRPNPEGDREPICTRKKCAIWTRWRPVTVKYAITRGPPVVAVAVSSDPILPHR